MKTSELKKRVKKLGYKCFEYDTKFEIKPKTLGETAIVIPKNVVIDLKAGSFESIQFTREVSELVKEYARTPINERG
ncbi:hypothetical protein [Atopobacter phocae]|uniref:hypothetical protein n=1 Tax=Atopobacter phocae TaxID=136492 RepID=UPI0004722F56|nr:hypothetical protein [Atopobacter phocae]